MLKELLQKEMIESLPDLFKQKMNDLELCNLSISFYQLIRQFSPDDPVPVSRIAEAHHVKGEIRVAGEYYRQVLDMEPVQPLTSEEESRVFQFAPLLLMQSSEFFDLMDVVAIHHPTEPMIAYHLFWEDDYDFPDDYEPCDHEQVWITYEPQSHSVRKVESFFHSKVLSSPEAVEEANKNSGQPYIRVEWGRHGSLVNGWQRLPFNEVLSVQDKLRLNFEKVSKGGRVPDHPLKRRWPNRFHGCFEDYVHFSKPVDSADWLKKKMMMAKSRFSNAVLQQYFLPYNFHPKFDWPC